MEKAAGPRIFWLAFIIIMSALWRRSAVVALVTIRGVSKRSSTQSARLLFHTRASGSLLDDSMRFLSWRRPSSRVSAARQSHSGLYMSTVDEEETENAATNNGKTLDSTWDISGLKKEVFRLIQRCHKKVGQASQRLAKAKETVEQLTTDPDATVEELERCPDIGTLTVELQQVKMRLRNLNTLEESLSTIGSKKNAVLPKKIAALAIDLGASDVPPSRPAREKKEKGPRRDLPSRKPYRRYFSYNNIEIRVGKKAEDNDELTMNPEHRDGSDWWMHAAGCPGSHVVIRNGQETIPEEVVQDAAALAARQSKCTGSVIKVSLTRCRDIKKPPGAKAGLVMLTGKVRTVTVNMKESESRLERLEKTVVVN